MHDILKRKQIVRYKRDLIISSLSILTYKLIHITLKVEKNRPGSPGLLHTYLHYKKHRDNI